MGAVYNVELKLSYASEQEVIAATEAYVNTNPVGARFSDVDYSSIVSAIQILLPKRGFQATSQTDNSIECDCGFDASYGWFSVMCEWFKAIAPVVDDGSTIKIWPDSGYTVGVVTGDTVEWNSNEDDTVPYDYYDEDDDSDAERVSVDDPTLQNAIDLIDEFSLEEYGDLGVSSEDDLSEIGLMFSQAGGDNEVDLWVAVNLISPAINYYVDGELRHTDTYATLQDLIDTELSVLSFDDLYHACAEYTEIDDYDPEASADEIRFRFGDDSL